MKTLIAIIALMLATTVTAPSPVAAQELDCAAIGTYLDEVDTAIAEEVHALVTQPGWMENAIDATARLNMGGDVSASEVEPIIELLTVPGDVLATMDATAIPESAIALHESAIGFWATFPEWSQANFAGNQEAVDAVTASMRTYMEASGTAQSAIDEGCPGLIDSSLEHMNEVNNLFDQLEDPETDPDALSRLSVTDLDGIGVYFLVLPAGMAGALASPAPVATAAAPDREPATVKAVGPDATPAATPGR